MSKKILIIDDEKEIAQIMKKKIQNAGYEAYVAHNGKEGLEIAHELHPHLILTDMAMPVMDGYMFYQELKNSKDLSHIPVIVATAHGTTEDQMRSLGAKDFMLKPFDMGSLLERVGTFFQGQKALKVLIATKMFHLMNTIIQETQDNVGKLELRLNNDPGALVNEALTFHPDLIMLDVDLFLVPKASDVVRILRQQESLRETPILLIRSLLIDHATGSKLSANQSDVGQCLSNGASHFVGALNRESFLNVVKEYCQ